MEKPEQVVVFITTATGEEAHKIAGILMEQKKAACINIIPIVHSQFWWEGHQESGEESLLIVKTRAAILPELITIVKQGHSNTVPEIIALPIIGGNAEYLDWINREVA